MSRAFSGSCLMFADNTRKTTVELTVVVRIGSWLRVCDNSASVFKTRVEESALKSAYPYLPPHGLPSIPIPADWNWKKMDTAKESEDEDAICIEVQQK